MLMYVLRYIFVGYDISDMMCPKTQYDGAFYDLHRFKMLLEINGKSLIRIA
jgi:hypothetical protein